MIEHFYIWLNNISKTNAIIFFTIAALSLAIIPYSNFIFRYLKVLISLKKLKIHYFEFYDINKHYDKAYHEKAAGNNQLNKNMIFIAGTKLKLIWRVSGAIKISISSIGNDLKGNYANIIINPEILQYELTIYGIGGKKLKSILEIPKDKLFYLDTSAIINSTNKTIRNNPIISTNTITKGNILISKFKYLNLSNLIPELIFKTPLTLRRKLNFKTHRLVKRKISTYQYTKFYTFSTHKYQNIK